jgi:uncharacterized protein (TIGR00299 family) protein
MNKVIVLDPVSGISGDMTLGALVEVGAPFDALAETLHAMPVLEKVRIDRKTVRRGPFEATHVVVECPEEHAHRTLADVRQIVEEAPLKERVKNGAIDTFTRLASAEARVHGQDVNEVHFHEVGALDAIVDIVGAHVALDLLGNPEGMVRPITLGRGATESEHGPIPVPAPATVELLSGYRVQFEGLNEELVTPTGAAILASRFRPLDPGAIVVPDRVGYGAGTRDREGMPNVLRAILGEVEGARGHVCVVKSTVDDMNPEVYGFLMEQLFVNGALDVYYDSVMMKKNRPGVEVTLICEEKDVYRLSSMLMSHTTTLGVRIQREERIELPRRTGAVDTAYGSIDVKIARRPDGTESASPEYESCRKAALANNVSLLEVYEAVQRAWKEGDGK